MQLQQDKNFGSQGWNHSQMNNMIDSLDDRSQMNNTPDSLDGDSQGWDQTKQQHGFLCHPVTWIREEWEKLGQIYYEQTIQEKDMYLEW